MTAAARAETEAPAEWTVKKDYRHRVKQVDTTGSQYKLFISYSTDPDFGNSFNVGASSTLRFGLVRLRGIKNTILILRNQ